MTQETLMRFDPATGNVKPYPSHAGQWRKYHGGTAWLFNPWAGGRRNALDVGSDPFGMAISMDGEPIYAANMGQAIGEISSGGKKLACEQSQPNRAQSAIPQGFA